MADYKEIRDKDNNLAGIERNSDKAFIPIDESNLDYSQYLEWADEGNTPDSSDPAYQHTWGYIREVRDSKLSSCDWTQLPDSPLTESGKTSYQMYRQSLRDVPQTYGTPQDVVWPEEPDV
jgi:hypothetical protein